MQIRRTTIVLAVAGFMAAGAALARLPDSIVAAGALAAADKAPVPMMQAPNYRAIVEQNASAVVGITTVGKRNQRMPSPFGEDSPFAPFFRGMPGVPRDNMPARGLGSGFIVSADGLILTNHHVVDDADKLTVKLWDDREFEAKVLGSDPATDIAVLKIAGEGLPTVRIGDPDALGVGDYVLAIGSPYGLEQTATAGIVSAKARSLPNDAYVTFIQTDVAVNPGNSGGPLFDASGAVVGINSQIYSNTGGYEGVSFAIPIDLAMHVRDQIEKHGKVEHALLGVSIQGLSQSLADAFGLKRPGGALVAKVEPDSAAEKAGIREGDVILSYEGQPIRDAGELSSRVGLAAPGDKVELEIWREGKTRTIKARLGAATELASAAAAGSASDAKLGLAVRPLTPEERRSLGVAEGLLVEDVTGAAAEAGIRPGDVVLSVDGKAASSVQALRERVARRGERVALLVQRGDMRIFIPVDLG